MQVLSSEDSCAARAREADDGFEEWLTANDPSETETEHSAANQPDIALPASPREIAFEGILRINGYAAGIICSSEGHLIVDAAGEVDADITVREVTIHGCVRGDIRATRVVELAGSARVVGDIETVALSIEPGAVFEGRCIFLQGSPAADSNSPDSVVNSQVL